MLQAVHGWSSTYERFVKSQKFFSSYLTQEDMSHFGRNYLEVGFYIEILFPENRYALSQCSNRQKPPPAKRGSGWSRWYERRGNLAPQWL